MKITPGRTRKAQLKMRGLGTDIRRFSDACTNVRGTVAPGPSVDIEDIEIDPVINAIDGALVTIRTLDLEVFQASDPKAYGALLDGLPEGRAVRALTAPRNNAVHHVDVIAPGLQRAVGPLGLGTDRFIVLPRWKNRSDLPVAMFRYPRGSKKGQDNVGYMASYDAGAAGRLVLDTLLDAFSFFDQCDPTIADRSSDGELVGFPLPPLPVAGYYRLEPKWPDHETVEQRIREMTQAVPPAGQHREITSRLDTDAGPVFCGYTTVDTHHKSSFLEAPDQIGRDLALGYVYRAPVAERMVKVVVVNAELWVDATRLVDLSLPSAPPVPWAGYWELCEGDADFYRSHRRA
jgi:hypothetical protein